ncbi:MAG TPA: dehydratase [Microscillaceae bacterium]|nr:dehydratase [Microscillaceae bacterium]
MSALVLNGLEDLKAQVGKELGVSEWTAISQAQIQQFADATGDHQWIHLNQEMAKMSPFGTTIAHGFLTLSLVPMLLGQIMEVKGVRMGINYGLNKVRFITPVPSGGKVRARATLQQLEEVQGGVQLTVVVTFELEGVDKPACVAESLMRYYF